MTMIHSRFRSSPRASSSHHRKSWRVLYFLSLVVVFRTFVALVNNRFSDHEQPFDDITNDEKPCNCSLQSSVTGRLAPQQELKCKEVESRQQRQGKQSLKKILTNLRRRHESDLVLLEEGELDEALELDNRSHIQLRVFPRRKSGIPCVKPGTNFKGWDTVQRTPAKFGLFYVKTYKTGSTTMMGVTVRMAIKAAERYNKKHNTTFPACKSRFDHWPAYLLNYRNRQRSKSFLFAVIREPTLRAISMFFHLEVSRGKVAPSDSNFLKFLTSRPTERKTYSPWGAAFDHYLHFMACDGYFVGSGLDDPDILTTTVNQILQDYNFIGITERIDESLVALQMILGLKTSDILYTSAKDFGSWDDQGVFIQPSFVSEGMEQFFASDTWRLLSKGDYMLYLAANASLDRTIDALGREKFDQKLALHRYAMNLVRSNCSEILPYWTAAGKTYETDCLVTDAGCGSKCFDRLEREFNL